MPRELNNHIKEVMKITPTKKSTIVKKVKTDYTKPILWISIGAITIAIWTTIYNLIF